MSEEMRAILFVAILIVAAVRPRWIFPLLVPVGTVALIIMVALWVLGTIMGIEGGR